MKLVCRVMVPRRVRAEAMWKMAGIPSGVAARPARMGPAAIPMLMDVVYRPIASPNSSRLVRSAMAAEEAEIERPPERPKTVRRIRKAKKLAENARRNREKEARRLPKTIRRFLPYLSESLPNLLWKNIKTNA